MRGVNAALNDLKDLADAKRSYSGEFHLEASNGDKEVSYRGERGPIEVDHNFEDLSELDALMRRGLD
jgi:hypothetical protein